MSQTDHKKRRPLAGLLTLSLLGLTGQAWSGEKFEGIYLPAVEYHESTHQVADLEAQYGPKVLIQNPNIVRIETPTGLVFSFQKGKEEIVRLEVPFSRRFELELPGSKVYYNQQSGPAFSAMSLQKAPQSHRELCGYSNDLKAFQRMLKTETNRINFKNFPGKLNTGVCWWHSRLERKATYLAFYSPQKAKPTSRQAKQILGKIRDGNQVVEIPGVSNLQEFTDRYEKETKEILESWMLTDSIFRAGWARGLQGGNQVSPQEFKNTMDLAYEFVVNQRKITYVMTQNPGFAAHSWLIVDMHPTQDGYVLQIADSSFPNQIKLVDYRYGMTQFQLNSGYGNFAVHLQRSTVNEVDQVLGTLRASCGR